MYNDIWFLKVVFTFFLLFFIVIPLVLIMIIKVKQQVLHKFMNAKIETYFFKWTAAKTAAKKRRTGS